MQRDIYRIGSGLKKKSIKADTTNGVTMSEAKVRKYR